MSAFEISLAIFFGFAGMFIILMHISSSGPSLSSLSDGDTWINEHSVIEVPLTYDSANFVDPNGETWVLQQENGRKFFRKFDSMVIKHIIPIPDTHEVFWGGKMPFLRRL